MGVLKEVTSVVVSAHNMARPYLGVVCNQTNRHLMKVVPLGEI